MKKYFYYSLVLCFFMSCRMGKSVFKSSEHFLFEDSIINSAHVGISIYEPSSNRYLYQKNADKYFVPASNTKLFTLYCGLKYLGDSLIGLQYFEKNDTVFILPTGDPTFLHSDFTYQPAYNFLNNQQHPIVVVKSRSFIILNKLSV